MLINKFVSVSLMTRKKNEQNREQSLSDELDFIKKLIYELNSHVKQSEIIIITHDADEKHYFLTSDLPDLSSVSIKIVSTSKRSKEYVLHNLGWKASIGDVICHLDLAPNLNLHSAYDLIKAIQHNENLTFLIDHNIVHQAGLYQLINHAYDEEVLPISTRGFVANRNTINSAFANQSEIFDPFVSLALSGVKYDKYSLTGATFVDHSWSRYTKQDEIDLLLQYTREHGFNELLEQTVNNAKFVMFVLTMLIFALIYNEPGITIALILSIFAIICFIACMFYSRLKAINILQQHSLAASLNKNLAGQIDISTRNSHVSEL